MTDFARSIISMTYDRGAKPSVSLGEMNPIDFADCSFVEARNARAAKSTAPGLARRMSRSAAWAAGDDPKWRRKPLESLKTDSQMAPRQFALGGQGDSIRRTLYEAGLKRFGGGGKPSP